MSKFLVSELDKIMEIVAGLKLKVLVDNVDDFVNKTMVLPVMDKTAGIKVDFIFSFSPYEKQAIERARDVKLGIFYALKM